MFCSFFFTWIKGSGGKVLIFIFIEGEGYGKMSQKIPSMGHRRRKLRRNFWRSPRRFQAPPQMPPSPSHRSVAHTVFHRTSLGSPTHGLAVLPSQKCLLFCSIRLPWASLICSWLLWCQGARKPGPTWSLPSLAFHSRCLSRERSVQALKYPSGSGAPGTVLGA